MRGFIHKGVVKMTNMESNSKKSQLLLTKEIIEKIENDIVNINTYRSAVSTCTAIAVMSLFTNFLIDAPLTMYLTNGLNKFSKVKEHEREEVKRA